MAPLLYRDGVIQTRPFRCHAGDVLSAIEMQVRTGFQR